MPIPNSTALVAQIKDDLIRRRVIPDPQRDNGDSFEITGRLAWALRQRGAKLIGKSSPAQNGWTIPDGPSAGQRVSHDAVAFPDGWVDLLASAGPPSNENRPVWQWHTEPPAGFFIEPYDLDALITKPEEPEEPEQPDGGGSVPLPDLLAMIQSAVATSLKADMEGIKVDLLEIRKTQARGLTGRVLGYTATFTPKAD